MRRTHSTIEKLPPALKSAVQQMIVDKTYPADYSGDKSSEPIGCPTYDDIVWYLNKKGAAISRSAVGRYAMQLRTISRMKQAGLITREVMSDLDNEKASATQKAVAEMITAATIEFVSQNEEFKSDQIRDIAKAMKDCTHIAINADKYISEQIKAKAQAAAASVDKVAKVKNIDPETLKIIKEQIYGIAG
jgi:hypothetical protein